MLANEDRINKLTFQIVEKAARINELEVSYTKAQTAEGKKTIRDEINTVKKEKADLEKERKELQK